MCRQRAVCAKSPGRRDVRDSALMPFSPELILIYGEDWVRHHLPERIRLFFSTSNAYFCVNIIFIQEYIVGVY
jgi:hypothetical protein